MGATEPLSRKPQETHSSVLAGLDGRACRVSHSIPLPPGTRERYICQPAMGVSRNLSLVLDSELMAQMKDAPPGIGPRTSLLSSRLPLCALPASDRGSRAGLQPWGMAGRQREEPRPLRDLMNPSLSALGQGNLSALGWE